MEKQNWTKCPACSVEWTKLRPCFFLDDEMKGAWSSVCVVCAETLVSFDWIARLSPMALGEKVQVKWSGPRRMKISFGSRDEEHEIPKNAYAVVELNDMKFIATSDGTGHPLKFKEAKDKDLTLADNTFALWSKIKNRVSDPHFEETAYAAVEKTIRQGRR